MALVSQPTSCHYFPGSPSQPQSIADSFSLTSTKLFFNTQLGDRSTCA